MRLPQGLPGVRRMMQGLAEEGEIDGTVVNGWSLDVSQAILEIGQAVFFGKLLAEVHHLA